MVEVVFIQLLIAVLVLAGWYVATSRKSSSTPKNKVTASNKQLSIQPANLNNKAEKALAPFINDIKHLNASVLCTDGDAGSGFPDDNTTPTFSVIYSVTDQSDLVQKVTSYASSMGYVVVADTTKINDLQTGNNISVGANGPTESYSPNNVYLTSDASRSFKQPDLNVEIIKGGYTSMNCNNTYTTYTYGEHKSPTPDQVILKVDLELYSKT